MNFTGLRSKINQSFVQEIKKLDEIDTMLITKFFNGDQTAYKKSLDDACYETIHWSDIEISNKVYPEFEDLALLLIVRQIGYLPPRHKTLSIEPFLRTLIHSYRIGQIQFADMIKEAQLYLNYIK